MKSKSLSYIIILFLLISNINCNSIITKPIIVNDKITDFCMDGKYIFTVTNEYQMIKYNKNNEILKKINIIDKKPNTTWEESINYPFIEYHDNLYVYDLHGKIPIKVYNNNLDMIKELNIIPIGKIFFDKSVLFYTNYSKDNNTGYLYIYDLNTDKIINKIIIFERKDKYYRMIDKFLINGNYYYIGLKTNTPNISDKLLILNSNYQISDNSELIKSKFEEAENKKYQTINNQIYIWKSSSKYDDVKQLWNDLNQIFLYNLQTNKETLISDIMESSITNIFLQDNHLYYLQMNSCIYEQNLK